MTRASIILITHYFGGRVVSRTNNAKSHGNCKIVGWPTVDPRIGEKVREESNEF